MKKTIFDNLSRDQKEAYEYLKKYVGGKQVYATIKSVAKSGMSRKMEFYVPNQDSKLAELEILRVGYYIATLLDYKYHSDTGLYIGGCGQDMIFHVLSELNYRMAEIDYNKFRYDISNQTNTRVYDKYFINAAHYRTL